VAKTLKNQELDLVARYGGEEFIMIIQNVTPERLHQIAEKIRTAIQATLVTKLDSPNETLKVTASFGGYVIPYKTINAVDLKSYIEVCDKNLYSSKKKGRNCVTVS
jgi:diguanylate cyclase (GGDEF)-like protein